MTISASCVTYKSDCVILNQTLCSLSTAIRRVTSDGNAVLFLANNSLSLQRLYVDLAKFELIEYHGHGNIGFGAGHNLAINKTAINPLESTYHLILNPDVIIDESALKTAIDYMDENPDVVLLSPESKDPETKQLQYQCKQFPSLFVLALRFLNVGLFNRLFAALLDRYEEKERINRGELFDAEIVSGCFMLFRTDALKQLGGFDERFFLYFEDFDLSIRAQKLGRVVYHPGVKIQHYGGGAGRKGWLHIKMFLRSAITFFKIHGWKLF